MNIIYINYDLVINVSCLDSWNVKIFVCYAYMLMERYMRSSTIIMTYLHYVDIEINVRKRKLIDRYPYMHMFVWI